MTYAIRSIKKKTNNSTESSSELLSKGSSILCSGAIRLIRCRLVSESHTSLKYCSDMRFEEDSESGQMCKKY